MAVKTIEMVRKIREKHYEETKDLSEEEYMIREFSTVGPQTPWPSIQKIIIEGNQRFLPVIQRGQADRGDYQD